MVISATSGLKQPAFTFQEDEHIYRLGSRVIPGIHEILGDAGFEFPSGNMELGTAVHLATELYDLGTLDWKSLSDEVLGYLMGWIKFRDELGFVPVRIEEKLYHPIFLFAGRLDRTGRCKKFKNPMVVEIKKYAPPESVARLQTAAQALLLPRKELPWKRIAVQLTAEGDYRIHHYDDHRDLDRWLSLVDLYWYKRSS